MIGEVGANHPLQPAPDVGRMAVQVSHKVRSNGMQRGPQTLAHLHTTHNEVTAGPGLPTEAREAQEVEGSGLPRPRRFRRSAAYRPNSISAFSRNAVISQTGSG